VKVPRPIIPKLESRTPMALEAPVDEMPLPEGNVAVADGIPVKPGRRWQRADPKLSARKSNESVRRRQQIPGHEIYLQICQQIGADPSGKKTIVVEAGDAKTALRVRVNFYSWRSAVSREMGADFALDNKLEDTKIYLNPVLDEHQEIVRSKRGVPIPNGTVTFYSVKAMPEHKALASCLPQLMSALNEEENHEAAFPAEAWIPTRPIPRQARAHALFEWPKIMVDPDKACPFASSLGECACEEPEPEPVRASSARSRCPSARMNASSVKKEK
jgi:hypothetical protein